MLYVTCLYLMLASPSHTTREYASRQIFHRISGWPHLYGQQVQDWMRHTTSPERRHRLIRPLAAYRSHLASRYQPPTPVWPCCDMLPGTDAGTRDRYSGVIWHTRAGCSEDSRLDAGPYWNRWRRGTELMARQMIREGYGEKDVDALLMAMWRIELDCECDHSAPREVLESWSWDGGYPLPR